MDRHRRVVQEGKYSKKTDFTSIYTGTATESEKVPVPDPVDMKNLDIICKQIDIDEFETWKSGKHTPKTCHFDRRISTMCSLARSSASNSGDILFEAARARFNDFYKTLIEKIRSMCSRFSYLIWRFSTIITYNCAYTLETNYG